MEAKAYEVLKVWKHGVLHKVGEIVRDVEDDVAKELVQLGVLKDLSADAKQLEAQGKQDLGTAKEQLTDDEEMVRGQVGSQMQAAIDQDVEDAKNMLDAPGTPADEASKPQGGAAAAPAAPANTPPVNTPPADPNQQGTQQGNPAAPAAPAQ